MTKIKSVIGLLLLLMLVGCTVTEVKRDEACEQRLEQLIQEKMILLDKQSDFTKLYEECNADKISCEKDLQMCLSQSSVLKQQLQENI